MFGQMTAGSWIYIGTQGILQGTYETFAEAGRQHFGGSWKGRWILTAGLGGMGGAQPLAATMNGACCLAVEVDPTARRAARRDPLRRPVTHSLDEALGLGQRGLRRGRGASRRARGQRRGGLPRARAPRGQLPDFVTEQTSAHDPLQGYVPPGLSLDEAAALRVSDPTGYVRARARGWPPRSTRCARCSARRVRVRLRQQPPRRGDSRRRRGRVRDPGLRAGVHPPAVLHGARALSLGRALGRPEDIAVTDRAVLEAVPDDPSLRRWIKLAGERVAYQGLPARICWLGYGERARVGQGFNDLVRDGQGEGAHRDRPRPPRLRLRRVAAPRDRGDARRLRRRSPTGPSSTRWSTAPAARPG
jgi:urocanate hydratase